MDASRFRTREYKAAQVRSSGSCRGDISNHRLRLRDAPPDFQGKSAGQNVGAVTEAALEGRRMHGRGIGRRCALQVMASMICVGECLLG